MTDDEAYDIWQEDHDLDRRERLAVDMGHLAPKPYDGFEDEAEKAIAKRTITCQGRKIRMEYYPGKGPRFCPCCGGCIENRPVDDGDE